MAKSTKGLKICITKGGVTPTNLTPTAVTAAKPAVVSATVTGVKNGDFVIMSGTGMPSIDGKPFVVANVKTGSFELLGSDTTGETYNAVAVKADHFADTDMVCLCLSSISIASDAPAAVSVATYCDPSASLPGAAASAGTLDFAGYVDITDADYAELLKAVDDGLQRYIRIMLPSNGYIVAPLTFSSITWDLPLDGGVGYAGQAVLGSKATHLF